MSKLAILVGEPKHHKNIAITFGHPSWDLSYHMLLGIRIAVAEAYSMHLRAHGAALEQRDFDLQVDYELRRCVCDVTYNDVIICSFSESNDSWIFREFAPVAFVHVREAFRIDHKHYMVCCCYNAILRYRTTFYD